MEDGQSLRPSYKTLNTKSVSLALDVVDETWSDSRPALSQLNCLSV